MNKLFHYLEYYQRVSNFVGYEKGLIVKRLAEALIHIILRG